LVDAGDGQPKPHWEILRSPAPPTATATDSAVAAMIQEELQKLLADTKPWIADSRSARNMFNRLRAVPRLGALGLKFGNKGAEGAPTAAPTFSYEQAPPTAENVARHVFIPFTYTPKRIAELRIDVSSAGAPAEPVAGVVAFKELRLPSNLRAELQGHDETNVIDRIRLRIWGSGTTFAPREEERLMKVAGEALRAAKIAGVLPDSFVPGPDKQGLVVRTLRGAITPAPDVRVVMAPGATDDRVVAVVEARNVLAISAVRIEASYDLASLLAPGTTVTPETRARLGERAAHAARELMKRFEQMFAEQIGTVLTHEEEAQTLTRLRQDPEKRVARADTPTFADGVLVYPVSLNPTVQTVGGSAGIEYAPREGLNGTLGLTEQNLLRLGEDGSVNVRGGPDSRRGDAALNFPLPRWMEDRITPLVSLHGLYSRLDDVVFGRGVSGVTEEEVTAGIRTSIVFRPWAAAVELEPGTSAEERRRVRAGWSDATALGADLDMSRRDVDLRGVTAPAGVPKDGVTAPVALTLRGRTSFDPGASTNEWFRGVDVGFDTTFERSLDVLGSEHRYERWDIRGSAAATFSVGPDVDIVVRYVHGYGVANDRAPLFRFFRAGGEANVRGLEEGEFVARTLQFQQVEAGVSLCGAYRVISRKVSTGDDRGCQVQNFDLTKTFAKLFFDHARLSDRFEHGRIVAAARDVFGFGAAVELRDLPVGGNQKLTLSIGYGYSPDSEKHGRGTVFTQVIMPFGLR
jgi:hypothetical protein